MRGFVRPCAAIAAGALAGLVGGWTTVRAYGFTFDDLPAPGWAAHGACLALTLERMLRALAHARVRGVGRCGSLAIAVTLGAVGGTLAFAAWSALESRAWPVASFDVHALRMGAELGVPVSLGFALSHGAFASRPAAFSPLRALLVSGLACGVGEMPFWILEQELQMEHLGLPLVRGYALGVLTSLACNLGDHPLYAADPPARS